MTDRHIRAMLRSATAAKILNGWQGPHLLERSYCIAPCNAAAAERPLADVISYCESLAAAGIQPLFRASEPRMYGVESSHGHLGRRPPPGSRAARDL
jgi:hypothetical protein